MKIKSIEMNKVYKEEKKKKRKASSVRPEKKKEKLAMTRRGRQSKGQPLTATMLKQKQKYLILQLDLNISIKVKERDRVGLYVICPLCGHKVHYDSKQCQNMHWIKRGIWLYRRDLLNLRAGCVRCNVMLHGNYDVYDVYMRKELGDERYWEMKNRQYECRKKPRLNKKPEIEELELLLNQIIGK